MDTDFIKDRLAKLRQDKDISARELSLQLGQSPSYINAIENGNSLPSMSMFLYICEYLKITPKEFFDVDSEYPKLINDIVKECNKLDKCSLESILTIVKNMNK